jgi:hypothetical protein
VHKCAYVCAPGLVLGRINWTPGRAGWSKGPKVDLLIHLHTPEATHPPTLLSSKDMPAAPPLSQPVPRLIDAFIFTCRVEGQRDHGVMNGTSTAGHGTSIITTLKDSLTLHSPRIVGR